MAILIKTFGDFDVGFTIGHLKVISKEPTLVKRDSGREIKRYGVECDCGNKFIITLDTLNSIINSRLPDDIRCWKCYDKEYYKDKPGNDIFGTKIGMLTILGFGPRVKREPPYSGFRITYWAQCDCGSDPIVVHRDPLFSKTSPTRSCGCLHDKQVKEMGQNNVKHGLVGTRIYDIYNCMMRRCFEPSTDNYYLYGGRGITVCPEWADQEDYKGLKAFYNWAIHNGYRDDLSIDRRDPNGNYCPENCRWFNDRMQANNKRNNIFITHCGETYTAAQWGRATGINGDTISTRIRRGMDPEKAITTPVEGHKINAIYFVDEWNDPIADQKINVVSFISDDDKQKEIAKIWQKPN